jgi:hypothetical protein
MKATPLITLVIMAAEDVPYSVHSRPGQRQRVRVGDLPVAAKKADLNVSLEKP